MASRASASPAREAALRCLVRVEQGRDAQEALDEALSGTSLDPRDAALVTELCYGCLRRRGRAEFVLAGFLKRPGDLPGQARLALRLAAYEILFLDRVPAYASVDWAVGHVRSRFGRGLAGAVNAVLRRVADLGPEAREEAFFRREAADFPSFLAAWHSAPGWLVELWLRAYGEETACRYLEAGSLAPPLGVRVNARRPGADGLFRDLAGRDDCLAAAAPGLALAVGAAPGLGELERAGRLSFQSLAGQEALRSLAPESWPGPVWDACAGRGGKTCQLLEAGLERVWASDQNRRRLLGLREELRRLDLPQAPVFLARADGPAPLRVRPGSILLDAPCTGLGVLSRRPDSSWRRSPEDPAALAAVQGRLLDACFEALGPGGRLAYLTCTLHPDENEGQVRAFLERTPRAALVLERSTPPDSPLREFFYAALLEKA